MGNKKNWYCIVLMIGVGFVSLVASGNQMRKPYATLQRGEYWSTPDDASLQVGKVTLYFSEPPMVNHLPLTVNTKHKDHVFFIPAADIANDQLHAIVQAAKKNNNKWYSVSLLVENKPMHGIKVVFKYDPAMVVVEHATFATPGSQGVSFRLYNKAMLDALKLHERSLLRIAYVSSHSCLA